MSANLDRSNWFGSIIRRTSLHLNSLVNQKMSACDISSSNYWILKLLWENDALTQTQLVEALGVTPASLTGMIDSMVKKGWLIRKSSPQDGRVKRIYLTEVGKELELFAHDLIVECEETICNGMTDEEIHNFRILLKKVQRNLEKVQSSKQFTS
ncbi:MarR family transcriptional regulator [Neobacillus sp. 3P2-tot-E-2]|uniref:MarR family winged helix-turn-helix transcriptional regulator n=1 Tax=Neobacillus sp. 3P2-tot-E-2 TaxID=3132212 RepID=UPI00399F186C